MNRNQQRDLIQIVTYHSRFQQAFKDLNLEWIEKHFRVEPKDIEQVENPQECLENGGQIFFVVLNERAVGTCAMYRSEHGKYELAKMAVDPTVRGRGFGDLLMEAAERWAQEQGAKEIYMLSNTVLSSAISLYQKHGYQVTNLGPHPDYARCNIELAKRL